MHPSKPSPTRFEVRKLIASQFSLKDETVVMPFEMHSKFGGDITMGRCHIYNDVSKLKKIEPKYRLLRMKLAEKTIREPRKGRKIKKNKLKKARGFKQKMEIRST